MQAFRTFLGDSDMLAYLAMMAPRLSELRRVLKPTGSLYLHCDPTASHYLKLLLDAVFAPTNFRNEIIWKRTTAHSSAKKFGPVHDVLLYYGKSDQVRWNAPARTMRLSTWTGITSSTTVTGVSIGEPTSARLVCDMAVQGNHGVASIRPSRACIGSSRLSASRNLIKRAESTGHRRGPMPQYKRYREELKGKAISDVWDDIDRINPVGAERLGYPTQKPQALLERILAASSDEGETVLDPFCGCGTTIAAAQKLNRRWIGIDITHLAITLIRSRLTDSFGAAAEYEVIGEPVSLPDATKLAHDDPYQFQWWALGLVGARPVEEKKGADKGVDGRIYFHTGEKKTRQIVLSVKAGHVSVSHLRDLRGVLEREQADIGVLISLEEPTAPMRKEAASAGFYTSPWGKHPRLQLLTVDELLTGKGIDRPPAHRRA